MSIGDSSYIPSADEAQELIDRLNEITDWHVRVREITETGGIVVQCSGMTPERESREIRLGRYDRR